MKRICLLAFVMLLSVSSLTYAQVGVGTTTPNISSALEVNATNKGVLLPSVNLTSSTMDLDGNASTVQPSGMLVFNSSSILSCAKNFCYRDGVEYKALKDIRTNIGTIIDHYYVMQLR